MPWPLPAVLAWSAAWLCLVLSRAADLPAAMAFVLACATGAVLAWRCQGVWRRLISAAGFPLSAWALGAAAGVPAWLWLLLLLPVLAAYPLRAWRDAPFFPTPANGLQGLEALVDPPRRVLDAGCGLGDGLLALRDLWPQARLYGLEWSRLLTVAAAWRCRGLGLQIRRADMWTASWAEYDLVYVFQRPESMARVFEKAARELQPDAWLVSLEFAVPGQVPWASVQAEGRRPLWIYRPAMTPSALAEVPGQGPFAP